MSPDVGASQSNAIVAAIGWLQSTLTGGVAISVAIIAVAWFGLMLMSGRLPNRRGALLILGCFMIFSAPSIAAGIIRELTVDTQNVAPPPMQQAPVLTPVRAQRSSRIPAYDPYAGAALPPRR